MYPGTGVPNCAMVVSMVVSYPSTLKNVRQNGNSCPTQVIERCVMTEIPNRPLTPTELEEFKAQKKLEKALQAVEEEYMKRAQEPSKWAGRLLAVLVVAIFLDVSGWITAFMSGSFYAAFATLLQAIETISIVGLAGFGIFGSTQAYQLQEAKKKVIEDHKG